MLQSYYLKHRRFNKMIFMVGLFPVLLWLIFYATPKALIQIFRDEKPKYDDYNNEQKYDIEITYDVNNSDDDWGYIK